MVLELRTGDVLRLKRTHPCGNDQWSVERLGADVGIRCIKCRRRVLIARPYLERRIQQIIREKRPGQAIGEAQSIQ